MRLTLRTLLAYLDDTLEPSQAREIGQKVTESDVAQELIERIKKVTRRRGLTIPPAAGPEKIDANTVSGYLDNDLPADKVAEVEEQALGSDVALAEIAACHQILALVLGEPAHVPPTARQRMYQLVKGREAIHSRRARRVGPRYPGEAAAAEDLRAARHGLVYRLLGAVVLGIGCSSEGCARSGPKTRPAPAPTTWASPTVMSGIPNSAAPPIATASPAIARAYPMATRAARTTTPMARRPIARTSAAISRRATLTCWPMRWPRLSAESRARSVTF